MGINAGLGGYGGSSYIDDVILRDRDANTAWHEEADSTREERRYYCQNWRADVVALLTDTGKMVEWVKYSSYGVPFALPAGDTDSDGDFDSTDLGNIGGTYDVREDVNLDGTVDTPDAQDALVINNGYVTLGRGVLSNPVTANRKGYAGYEYDPTFEGASRHLYHVRHRVYDADVGRWTRRDPLGYVDGMSLYEYVSSLPIPYSDLAGLSGGGPKDKDKKKSKKKRKNPLDKPFDHERHGAYFKWRVNCNGHIIEREGWGRVDDIMAGLSRMAQFGCCIEYFTMSNHHSTSGSWSCDDRSDMVTDPDFANSLPPLCDGARLDLNSCNSCALAERIKQNNPNAKDIKIECTDGENAHHPGIGIDFTPLNPDGKDKTIKQDTYRPGASTSRQAHVPDACPYIDWPISPRPQPRVRGRCQNYSGVQCHDTYR
jgi:RHS repeat-associated protein